jgi:hypothetical protein
MKLATTETDFKDAKGKTYGGMNYYAAKKLGIKYPYSEDTVTASKSSDKLLTWMHEIIELEVFRAKKDLSYEDAHSITLMVEEGIRLAIEVGVIASE